MKENKSLTKYGLGIVFDWTSADLANRKLGEVEEYVFTIPTNTIQDEPIVISPVQKEANARMRIRIEVGTRARVALIQNIQLREYCELEVEVQVAEGANVEYTIVQNAHADGFLQSAYSAQVEKDASLTWFDVEMGGKIVSSDIETNLVNENASGKTFGLVMGSGGQAFDIHHRVNHLAPQTVSYMETKGVLDDSAKTIYRGLIHIPKDVPGANGYERCDTLLLSKQAQVSTIPELEIGNNDVKCGHASTISRIDKDKLFYFQSRGIAADEAVRETALGHALTIVDKIQNQKVRDEIIHIIESKM